MLNECIHSLLLLELLNDAKLLYKQKPLFHMVDVACRNGNICSFVKSESLFHAACKNTMKSNCLKFCLIAFEGRIHFLTRPTSENSGKTEADGWSLLCILISAVISRMKNFVWLCVRANLVCACVCVSEHFSVGDGPQCRVGGTERRRW